MKNTEEFYLKIYTMLIDYKKYTPEDIFVSYLGREATEEDIAAGYEPGQKVYNRKTGIEVFDIFTDLVRVSKCRYPEFYAEKFGVTTEDMLGYFRVMSGMAAKDWIEKYYLLVAVELLEKTNRPIIEIAKATGFSAVASFSGYFAKQTGTPPVTWRKKKKRR